MAPLRDGLGASHPDVVTEYYGVSCPADKFAVLEARSISALAPIASANSTIRSAYIFGMDPTTFAAVRSMEALGYVVRRPVPGDRRKRDVFLTAQGRALEARLVPLAREINTLAVRGVSRADVAATRRTLLAMLGNLAVDEASADTPKHRSRA